jgi:hypothetical protein
VARASFTCSQHYRDRCFLHSHPLVSCCGSPPSVPGREARRSASERACDGREMRVPPPGAGRVPPIPAYPELPSTCQTPPVHQPSPPPANLPSPPHGRPPPDQLPSTSSHDLTAIHHPSASHHHLPSPPPITTSRPPPVTTTQAPPPRHHHHPVPTPPHLITALHRSAHQHVPAAVAGTPIP